jgi:hypothetical protein
MEQLKMEQWERDFEWLRVRTIVQKSMQKEQMPDFQAMLFLIGIQELGRIPKAKFSKEEKQDLMHVAVCTLLEPDGYYLFEGRDHDGWPHYRESISMDVKGVKEQESFLIEKIIAYFNTYNEVTAFQEI